MSIWHTVFKEYFNKLERKVVGLELSKGKGLELSFKFSRLHLTIKNYYPGFYHFNKQRLLTHKKKGNFNL